MRFTSGQRREDQQKIQMQESQESRESFKSSRPSIPCDELIPSLASLYAHLTAEDSEFRNKQMKEEKKKK